MLNPQAFCLPIIQIVYEALRDRREGKKPKASVSGGCLYAHCDL